MLPHLPVAHCFFAFLLQSKFLKVDRFNDRYAHNNNVDGIHWSRAAQKEVRDLLVTKLQEWEKKQHPSYVIVPASAFPNPPEPVEYPGAQQQQQQRDPSPPLLPQGGAPSTSSSPEGFGEFKGFFFV